MCYWPKALSAGVQDLLANSLIAVKESLEKVTEIFQSAVPVNNIYFLFVPGSLMFAQNLEREALRDSWTPLTGFLGEGILSWASFGNLIVFPLELLHSEREIDPVYRVRPLIGQALTSLWFGGLLTPKPAAWSQEVAREGGGGTPEKPIDCNMEGQAQGEEGREKEKEKAHHPICPPLVSLDSSHFWVLIALQTFVGDEVASMLFGRNELKYSLRARAEILHQRVEEGEDRVRLAVPEDSHLVTYPDILLSPVFRLKAPLVWHSFCALVDLDVALETVREIVDEALLTGLFKRKEVPDLDAEVLLKKIIEKRKTSVPEHLSGMERHREQAKVEHAAKNFLASFVHGTGTPVLSAALSWNTMTKQNIAVRLLVNGLQPLPDVDNPSDILSQWNSLGLGRLEDSEAEFEILETCTKVPAQPEGLDQTEDDFRRKLSQAHKEAEAEVKKQKEAREKGLADAAAWQEEREDGRTLWGPDGVALLRSFGSRVPSLLRPQNVKLPAAALLKREVSVLAARIAPELRSYACRGREDEPFAVVDPVDVVIRKEGVSYGWLAESTSGKYPSLISTLLKGRGAFKKCFDAVMLWIMEGKQTAQPGEEDSFTNIKTFVSDKKLESLHLLPYVSPLGAPLYSESVQTKGWHFSSLVLDLIDFEGRAHEKEVEVKVPDMNFHSQGSADVDQTDLDFAQVENLTLTVSSSLQPDEEGKEGKDRRGAAGSGGSFRMELKWMVLDGDGRNLCRVRRCQPLGMWIAQLLYTLDVSSQAEAAEALGFVDPKTVSSTLDRQDDAGGDGGSGLAVPNKLSELMGNGEEIFVGVRLQAAAALARLYNRTGLHQTLDKLEGYLLRRYFEEDTKSHRRALLPMMFLIHKVEEFRLHCGTFELFGKLREPGRQFLAHSQYPPLPTPPATWGTSDRYSPARILLLLKDCLVGVCERGCDFDASGLEVAVVEAIGALSLRPSERIASSGGGQGNEEGLGVLSGREEAEKKEAAEREKESEAAKEALDQIADWMVTVLKYEAVGPPAGGLRLRSSSVLRALARQPRLKRRVERSVGSLEVREDTSGPFWSIGEGGGEGGFRTEATRLWGEPGHVGTSSSSSAAASALKGGGAENGEKRLQKEGGGNLISYLRPSGTGPGAGLAECYCFSWCSIGRAKEGGTRGPVRFLPGCRFFTGCRREGTEGDRDGTETEELIDAVRNLTLSVMCPMLSEPSEDEGGLRTEVDGCEHERALQAFVLDAPPLGFEEASLWSLLWMVSLGQARPPFCPRLLKLIWRRSDAARLRGLAEVDTRSLGSSTRKYIARMLFRGGSERRKRGGGKMGGAREMKEPEILDDSVDDPDSSSGVPCLSGRGILFAVLFCIQYEALLTDSLAGGGSSLEESKEGGVWDSVESQGPERNGDLDVRMENGDSKMQKDTETGGRTVPTDAFTGGEVASPDRVLLCWSALLLVLKALARECPEVLSLFRLEPRLLPGSTGGWGGTNEPSREIGQGIEEEETENGSPSFALCTVALLHEELRRGLSFSDSAVFLYRRRLVEDVYTLLFGTGLPPPVARVVLDARWERSVQKSGTEGERERDRHTGGKISGAAKSSGGGKTGKVGRVEAASKLDSCFPVRLPSFRALERAASDIEAGIELGEAEQKARKEMEFRGDYADWKRAGPAEAKRIIFSPTMWVRGSHDILATFIKPVYKQVAATVFIAYIKQIQPPGRINPRPTEEYLDFTLIQRRLEKGEFPRFRDFRTAYVKLFKNARIFNKGEQIALDADTIQKNFEELFKRYRAMDPESRHRGLARAETLGTHGGSAGMSVDRQASHVTMPSPAFVMHSIQREASSSSAMPGSEVI
uniref:Bromo domain-containing protein n=1 Tax=Chromera velia CCMP2878 TaxID=1169474 RepID=A0A0G4I763_9ALVE|eukprot:Cvel_11609.t1-p1 / transcript=Cvel_11609.t1 / gene=Cvel_11609 / organism=Chromera_velia_CCMP2878 / gene_product=hypothetical protein / transcript_product=hypothetical protein / location=Cvel_scaffold735:19855-30890(-) / protein_length=1833 / sequence_SO=supercontig / SO=protein_coding / is_pseudo=false